jgi:hypothetical protein
MHLYALSAEAFTPCQSIWNSRVQVATACFCHRRNCSQQSLHRRSHRSHNAFDCTRVANTQSVYTLYAASTKWIPPFGFANVFSDMALFSRYRMDFELAPWFEYAQGAMGRPRPIASSYASCVPSKMVINDEGNLGVQLLNFSCVPIAVNAGDPIVLAIGILDDIYEQLPTSSRTMELFLDQMRLDALLPPAVVSAFMQHQSSNGAMREEPPVLHQVCDLTAEPEDLSSSPVQNSASSSSSTICTSPVIQTSPISPGEFTHTDEFENFLLLQ